VEYGLELVLRDEDSSERIPANVRWMAPEVLGIKDRRVPSGDGGKATDVYSLAMIMFEVCLPRFYIRIRISTSHP
jgi:serine/threonine protein kinase